MPAIPEWTTYLVTGAIVGLILAGRKVYSHPAGKAAKRQGGKAARRVVDSFLGGFCLAFVCSLNIYDVSVYVLPSETIYYESEY